jgi:hypothetical protein
VGGSGCETPAKKEIQQKSNEGINGNVVRDATLRSEHSRTQTQAVPGTVAGDFCSVPGVSNPCSRTENGYNPQNYGTNRLNGNSAPSLNIGERKDTTRTWGSSNSQLEWVQVQNEACQLLVQDRNSEALTKFQEALDQQISVLGHEIHPNVALTMQNLANVHRILGNTENSISCYCAAAEIYRQVTSLIRPLLAFDGRALFFSLSVRS